MDSHIYGIDKTKYVYVLDRAGRPLMPTRRYGHVEKILRSGKARIAGRVPFVIQLKYDTQAIYNSKEQAVEAWNTRIYRDLRQLLIN